MQVTETGLAGALILEPKRFGDARGHFFESFNARTFASLAGLEVDFVQDNHSFSQAGVLRGLHYQLPRPQGKLVRVVRGAVLDLIVDLHATLPARSAGAGGPDSSALAGPARFVDAAAGLGPARRC